MDGVRKVGNPEDYARKYEDAGIDEIVFLDSVASLYRRNHLSGLLRSVSDVFVPVACGGGVRSTVGARELLNEGADKIVINTGAVERPELINELAAKLGGQSVVLQLDTREEEVFCDAGRQRTNLNALEWAQEAVERGAGEVFFTSIPHEGTGRGINRGLLERLCDLLPVPVLYCGGVGTTAHIIEAHRAGASGVAMAKVLHYGELTLEHIRDDLRKAGIPCRKYLSPEPKASSEVT